MTVTAALVYHIEDDTQSNQNLDREQGFLTVAEHWLIVVLPLLARGQT